MKRLLSCTRTRNAQHGERGVAFTEFLLTAPFLFILCAGVVDIGMVLGQYIRLSEAVHTGLRLGTSYSQLEQGTFEGLTTGQSTTCTRIGSSVFHQAIQQRVQDLIVANNRLADLSTLCISSKVVPSTSDPTKYLVKVHAQLDYQTLLPILPMLLSRIPISVDVSGPMLD